jgi:hypothetical protein
MLLLNLSASFFAFAQDGIVVQDPSLTLRWQVALNPAQPLTWCWDNADNAKITVRCIGGETTYGKVARSEDDEMGEFTLSIPLDFYSGVEYLYDVTLELFTGEELVRSESARIAFLPGVEAGGMIVKNPLGTDWGKIKNTRLFAYPRAEVPELVVTKDSAGLQQRELAAAGGFDAIVPSTDLKSSYGTTSVSIKNGDENLLSAQLRYYALRMSLIVR